MAKLKSSNVNNNLTVENNIIGGGVLSASSGKLKDRNISTNKTYRKIFTDNSQ